MALQIKLVHPDARVPNRGSLGAAGYDVTSVKDIIIPPGQRSIVPTGLHIAVPHGTYGRIAPRSGLAAKHGIDVLAGVIDEDYRGEVGVILVNHGSDPFVIGIGDRIAQLILEKIDVPIVVCVKDLDATDRGGGGFGSTGV
jgi:dUTP pyrophosphatase